MFLIRSSIGPLLVMLAVGALALGFLVSTAAGWMTAALGLGLMLVGHLRHLARLERWSRQPGPDSSLNGDGIWDEIFARIYRHEKSQKAEIAQRDAAIERFTAAGEALTDGVVMLGAGNQVDWCNGMAEQQLGLSLAVDRGQPITNLVRMPEFIDYLKALNFDQPLILRSALGREQVLSIHILPYAGDRRLMQVRDVTQADRLDQMRRDFVANVSHELRTPLTVLSGFIETLQEIEVDRDERIRYLGLLAEQSDRMLRIVQDLLTLSSLEAAPPPENTPVDMRSLLDRLRRDADALSGGQHRIVLEIDPLLDLLGSESELTSAFGNLVSNAIRYTPPGGVVTLVWHRLGDGAEFAVQDSGIGIDPRHIPRLTERFYRVDRGRSRDTGGTGLGLAIVKHALSRHNGRLDVRSVPGQGSRFAAVLPARRLISASPEPHIPAS